MKQRTCFAIALLAAASLSSSFATAATLSKADYNAAKSRISADYKAGQQACASLAANAKDVCVVDAKGKEKVARADLEFRYSGKPADGSKLRVATAEAAYALAKEKCDDLAGNDKDVCVKAAKAVEVKALAEAKLGKQIGEARADAVKDIRDANVALAVEKCDALAGDAKDACIATAKAAKAAPAVVVLKPTAVEAAPAAKKEKKGGC
ncbi:MAG: hypothetical protein Q8K45_12050 [Rubrivivax sp.]|nr:hypothetical protein [Rubrivivax sp.]